MAPHPNTLTWKIPRMEEPGRLRSMGSLRLDTTERLHFHFSLSHTEGNGNPLQCSCLENPKDRGAWWAAVYGVAERWTRLKRLSSSSSSLFNCYEKAQKLIQAPSPMHESEVAQSCPTLRHTMDCSLPGSSIHGILQARVLEWGAIAFSDLNKLGGLKQQKCNFSHFWSQKTKIEVSGRATLS